VHPRERWQALQTTLTAARSAVERGDQAAALAAVDEALQLDPNFLAAQALRNRIVAGELVPTSIPVAPAAAIAPAPVVSDAAPIEPKPLVSHEGYAKFEQRAKRRRVDRRIDAARQAIEGKLLKQAAAALDEVIELDPNLPELTELTTKFDQLRRSSGRSHRGPWLVAAAVFAGTVLGATWLQESSSRLFSRSMITAAALPAALTPAADLSAAAAPIESEPLEAEPVATVAERAKPIESSAPVRRTVDVEPPPPARAMPTPAVVRAIEPSAPPPPVQAVLQSPPAPPEPAPAFVPPSRPVQEAAVVAAVTTPVAPPVPPKVEEAKVDDPALVRQTLQRYRSAYEDLDARSAHAVWPAVNQVALARAFDGLESQSLTFHACDVRVRGDAATATCQGSARYVPKIGNREPRIESRVWTFSLHKAGADWKIDSARAERN
jgi:hypothetical protein